MRRLRVAAVQMAMSDDVAQNVATAERLVRTAVADGANLVLLPELFEGRYFCEDQSAAEFDRARPLLGHPTVDHFASLARELRVVLPVSFFERAGNAAFNSVAVVDADGSVLGVYRKSHIPDGPGYSEKYYFNPGDTGFRVWNTAVGRVGIGICWDQWFPECARVLALRGAEVILYPTAIGSEPLDPGWDSSRHWQRVMQGHAGANLVPVVAANRVGRETGRRHDLEFYGTSFVAGPTGEILVEADRSSEAIIAADFDLDDVARFRRGWGVFRDRRPNLYGPIIELDDSN